MLLQALVEYADQLDLPPALYVEAPLRYIISLDQTGRLLDPRPSDTADPSNRRTRRGQPHPLPQVQRAYAVRPLLLADNAEYTLGLPKQGSRPDRARACHAAFVDLVDRCARETGEPAVAAVRTFLSQDPLAQLDRGDDFDPGAIIGFDVDGTIVTDLPAVQGFWAAINDPDADPNAPARRMQCLVCGNERPVLQRLQAKIKGVPGGQTSGTAIISANADAFLSYGLEASLIAPTCAPCGERFTKSLNALLASPSHRVIIAGAAFAFWPRRKVDFDLATLLTDPKPDEVRVLFDSPRHAGPRPDIDTTEFYAAELAASGGRVSVRDWIDTTIGEVKDNLVVWFQRQSIVGTNGEPPRPLSLYALAGATVRELRDLSPLTTRVLVRAAIAGSPLPTSLVYEAVRRSRAEQRVTMQRAALIKLALPSMGAEDKEKIMVQLDTSNPNAGYQCGRLLAVLEEAQRRAIPGINATLVDRYYGSASSAPASVFAHLLTGVQPHLSKLERDRRGTYLALQSQLEEVLGAIRDFPRTLSLGDQGRFALGYYHQRAFNRQQAREAAARRQQTPTTDSQAAQRTPPTAEEEDNAQ